MFLFNVINVFGLHTAIIHTLKQGWFISMCKVGDLPRTLTQGYSNTLFTVCQLSYSNLNNCKFVRKLSPLNTMECLFPGLVALF